MSDTLTTRRPGGDRQLELFHSMVETNFQQYWYFFKDHWKEWEVLLAIGGELADAQDWHLILRKAGKLYYMNGRGIYSRDPLEHPREISFSDLSIQIKKMMGQKTSVLYWHRNTVKEVLDELSKEQARDRSVPERTDTVVTEARDSH